MLRAACLSYSISSINTFDIEVLILYAITQPRNRIRYRQTPSSLRRYATRHLAIAHYNFRPLDAMSTLASQTIALFSVLKVKLARVQEIREICSSGCWQPQSRASER